MFPAAGPAQVMDRDTIQGIAVKFETTPSEIARINKKPTLTFSIFPGDVSLNEIDMSVCIVHCSLYMLYIPHSLHPRSLVSVLCAGMEIVHTPCVMNDVKLHSASATWWVLEPISGCVIVL